MDSHGFPWIHRAWLFKNLRLSRFHGVLGRLQSLQRLRSLSAAGSTARGLRAPRDRRNCRNRRPPKQGRGLFKLIFGVNTWENASSMRNRIFDQLNMENQHVDMWVGCRNKLLFIAKTCLYKANSSNEEDEV